MIIVLRRKLSQGGLGLLTAEIAERAEKVAENIKGDKLCDGLVDCRYPPKISAISGIPRLKPPLAGFTIPPQKRAEGCAAMTVLGFFFGG